MGFRDFVFRELIFPKVLTVEEPGMIISKRVTKFSGNSKMRVSYVFEDFAIDLYNGTIETIGKEKADLLWYKISKDSALRYMMFSGGKKVPSFMKSSVLKYIFDSLSFLGVSFADTFSVKGKSIVTDGKNCLICRRTGAGCIPAGHLSAIWSYVNGENIEAEPRCKNCPEGCRIVANKNIGKKYDIDWEKLVPMDNYNKLNFPEDFPRLVNGISFGDLVRFGKVKFNDKKSVLCYEGMGITYIEVGLLELVYQGYEEFSQEDLFRSILLRSSERIAGKLRSGNYTKDLKDMEVSMIAFGWGIPTIMKRGKEVIFNFKCPPISKYPPVFRATVLNGFLNSILEKKYSIKKIDHSEIVFQES